MVTPETTAELLALVASATAADESIDTHATALRAALDARLALEDDILLLAAEAGYQVDTFRTRSRMGGWLSSVFFDIDPGWFHRECLHPEVRGHPWIEVDHPVRLASVIGGE